MGVPAFVSVRTDDIHVVVEEIESAGVKIVATKERVQQLPCDRIYRCQFNKSEIELWIDDSSGTDDESIVIVPYPPYSYAFWRWRNDHRLFDHLMSAACRHEYMKDSGR